MFPWLQILGISLYNRDLGTLGLSRMISAKIDSNGILMQIFILLRMHECISDTILFIMIAI